METSTGELLVRRIHIRKQLKDTAKQYEETRYLSGEVIEHRMRLHIEMTEIDKELKRRDSQRENS